MGGHQARERAVLKGGGRWYVIQNKTDSRKLGGYGGTEDEKR